MQIRENTVRVSSQDSSRFTIGEIMSKAGMCVVKMEITTVGLLMVVPSIPRDPVEKDQLKEDLKRMDCEGLIAQPWTLKSREMVQEFLWLRTNQWKNTIWRLPEKWTADS